MPLEIKWSRAPVPNPSWRDRRFCGRETFCVFPFKCDNHLDRGPRHRRNAPLTPFYELLADAPWAYDSQRIETFAVEDFGYVQHLNHFYDIDLIKTSPRILPVSIQSASPRLSYGPFKLFSPRKGTPYTTFNLKCLAGDRGGSQDPSPRRARGAGRSVRPTRASRVSEVGQRWRRPEHGRRRWFPLFLRI